MTILALSVFILFYLVSIAGILLPLLPGVPVAAVGALLAAWMTGFEGLGWTRVLIVAGLAVLAQLLDYIAALIGASRYGASRAGLWGSVIGSLLGLFFFPPFGFLIGALLGAVLAELLTGRPLPEAGQAGLGALVGTLGGIVAKLFIIIAIGVVVFPALI